MSMDSAATNALSSSESRTGPRCPNLRVISECDNVTSFVARILDAVLRPVITNSVCPGRIAISPSSKTSHILARDKGQSEIHLRRISPYHNSRAALYAGKIGERIHYENNVTFGNRAGCRRR